MPETEINMLTYGDELNIAVIGASGAVGSAFVNTLSQRFNVRTIFACSRSKRSFDTQKVVPLFVDLEKEVSIQEAAKKTSEFGPLCDCCNWNFARKGFVSRKVLT